MERLRSSPSMGSNIMDTTDHGEANAQRSQKLRNNPFIPPSDGSCPVNRFPPEILSLIFEYGTAADILDEADKKAPLTWKEFWRRVGDRADEGSGEQKGQIQEEKGEHETKVIKEEGSDAECERSEYPSGLSHNSEICLPFQIVVSQVCRHWRTLALGTSSLWTRIEVSCTHQPPYEQVIAFLERSKSLPLDICIGSKNPIGLLDDRGEPMISKANLEMLFTLLVPHISRWGSIEVNAASYEHMYAFLKAVSDRSVPPASQLRVLQLYCKESEDSIVTFPINSELSDHLTLFSGSAPRLQNISLCGVHVDWSQSWLRSPCLVELQLAYHLEDFRPHWPTFFAMLRATAPTLKRLSLEMSGPSVSLGDWTIGPGTLEWSDANSSILLPQLIQLELAFIPPFEIIPLLGQLCMPSLKGLALKFDDRDYADLVTYLVGPTTIPAASSSQARPRSLLRGLESFKLAGLLCSDESIKQMYNELVNLESLNLSMRHLSFRFFEDLRPRLPQTLEDGSPDTTVPHQVFLPRLTTLFTSGISGYDVRPLVQGRQRAGVPLRMVFVPYSVFVHSEEERWLKENLEKFDYFEESDDEYLNDHGSSISSSYRSSSLYGGWDGESAPEEWGAENSFEEWDAEDDGVESGGENDSIESEE